jgi:plasmid stabilization system protein ParE
LKGIRWKEAAAVEAEDAAAWYDDRSERGGKRFLEAMWAAISLVRDYPEAGTPYGLPVRRVVFRTFLTASCTCLSATQSTSWR